jgi:hypothetical protein
VLGMQEHMPTTRWPSRSTTASDALSDDVFFFTKGDLVAFIAIREGKVQAGRLVPVYTERFKDKP